MYKYNVAKENVMCKKSFQETKMVFEELCRQLFGNTEQTKAFALEQESLWESGVRDARLHDVCIVLIDG